MYTRLKYTFRDSNEFEFKFPGRYGARGEKREPKKKATPEQVKKQNQYHREKNMRRLIKANFTPGDYWITLKYKRRKRPPLGQVLKDHRNFIARLRRRYKKAGEELKYILRIEIGKNDGIHIHMIINRVEDMAELPIKEEWGKVKDNAGIYFTHLYQEGDYQELAEYIVKLPNEDVMEQISLFPEEEQKQLIKYSRSRNLIVPEPEKRQYKRLTMQKILAFGPKPSSEEYYIDKSSIRQGVNQITGFSYLYYTERRIGEMGGGGG